MKPVDPIGYVNRLIQNRLIPQSDTSGAEMYALCSNLLHKNILRVLRSTSGLGK